METKNWKELREIVVCELRVKQRVIVSKDNNHKLAANFYASSQLDYNK